MHLQSGTRLGPYEIVARIGAGGMGEVWSARDTRLDRLVAIKVLPPEFAENAQLKLRFEREARTISQLEHPNICRLYDVGDDYLVMELLDGESLAARLERGPLAAADVVKYGVQIAEALDRAHRRGVIHRDLKPGNIMLTKSGAKLLDFGLARPAAPEEKVVTEARTLRAPLTEKGVIVGTSGYMSPEQVRGEELDARSDIFSFGVVLYEMLSGRRAFSSRSAVETMHSILHGDPTPLSSDATVPALLAAIVDHCLKKDREERFQSAGDIAFALRAAPTQSGASVAPVQPQTRHRLQSWMWLAIGALLLVAGVIAGRFLPWPHRGGARELTSFEISFPADSPLENGIVAISPDGSRLVYVRRSGDTTGVYVRSLASLQDTLIEGGGAESPFFSPDGSSLGFCAAGKLKIFRFSDGQIVSVADTGAMRGASWGTDGTIIYSSRDSGTLFRTSEHGGDPREITHLDHTVGEFAHMMPQILDDNRTVLFARAQGFGTDSVQRIEAMDLTTGKRRVVVPDAGDQFNTSTQYGPPFRWLADGFLLYLRQSRLWAVRFDPDAGATRGEPVPVIDPMSRMPFAVSRNGTLVYYAPGAALDSPTRLVRVTASGREEPLSLPAGMYRFLSLSPDERQVALSVLAGGVMRLSIADLARGTVSPLPGDGSSHLVTWTLDSQRVIYSSTGGGGASNLAWRRADGSDQPQRLLNSADHQDPGSISPDGRWLAYADRHPQTKWDIWLMPMTPPRTLQPFLRTGANEYSPMISPDGRRIAFVSTAADDRAQIFVDSFPTLTNRVYVSDGRNPQWSPDGGTLYYQQNLRLFAIDVGADRTISRPRAIAERDGVTEDNVGFGPAPYAVMKDRSVVMFRRTTAPTLIVIMNWTSELKKRVATTPAR